MNPVFEESPDVVIACEAVAADPYAAGPTVLFRLRATDPLGRRVHAMALRCQIRVEPLKRSYTDAEAARVVDLFGQRGRWGSTMHQLQLAFWSQVLPGFTGETSFEIALPLSYDVEVAAHKYLAALDDGQIPLVLLFSGQLFTTGEGGRLAVQPLPWHTETSIRLPVSVWREAMDAHFPGQAWVRISRETYDRLAERRSRLGLVGWDALLDGLLEAPDE